jgi:hypothetical protein
MLAESMGRISGLLQAGRYHEAHAQLESVVTANPNYNVPLARFDGPPPALLKTLDLE